MQPVTIGLIREGKTPPDKRVALTPQQCAEVMQRYPQASVQVVPSPARCYRDEEYAAAGCIVNADLQGCHVLFGIKEVPVDQLIPQKTYFFFSHTIKKQPYNRKLLQAVLKKNITLVDYEALKDLYGNRLVAFGRYAGIVGAYNGLWAYGVKYGCYTLRRAYDCFDVNDLKRALREVRLPPVKIVLTGAGRVARGAMETLDTAGIRKVPPDVFLNTPAGEPVYVQLASADYHQRIDGGAFNREEFHQHPERYRADFLPFARVADVLVAGAFWNPHAPVLFTPEAMCEPTFALRVVADITCDIAGSVPCTVRASTIAEPLYDYLPATREAVPFRPGSQAITVMAIDNLPCELPRSASEEFGRDLIDKILPPLLGHDPDAIVERATIARGGVLNPVFSYLSDYVNVS